MNDFTKEELEIILNGLLWRDERIMPHERTYKLHWKIHAMIDNYCEQDDKCERRIWIKDKFGDWMTIAIPRIGE